MEHPDADADEAQLGNEEFLGSVVILATVQAAEADAADGIGCGDPGKNGYAGGDVEVLAPSALPEH
jgi:hypothetical protein